VCQIRTSGNYEPLRIVNFRANNSTFPFTKKPIQKVSGYWHYCFLRQKADSLLHILIKGSRLKHSISWQKKEILLSDIKISPSCGPTKLFPSSSRCYLKLENSVEDEIGNGDHRFFTPCLSIENGSGQSSCKRTHCDEPTFLQTYICCFEITFPKAKSSDLNGGSARMFLALEKLRQLRATKWVHAWPPVQNKMQPSSFCTF